MNRIAQVLMLLFTVTAASLNPGSAQARDGLRGFSVAELDQMLAPVALYPDTVLSHVLIAATYPIEVVQAARWTRQNPGLLGEQAVNAVIGQEWDPSVMALVAFPEVLARMDSDLDWTQRLGDAFLIQEADVLDSIQRLRAQAYSAGHLRSTEQVQVIREREVIYIEPPRREVVFVPVYDTRVVFGSWAWVHHPPIFWHAPPRHRSRVVVYWGPAFHVPSAFFFSSFHWSQRHVVVVHHHHHYFRPHHPRSRTVVHHHHHHYRGRDLARHDGAQRWNHDPGHRRGVAYHPAVDPRHRQLERRSTPATNVSSAPAVRVADTRNSQREWADSRRAETLLPQAGAQSSRSVRAASEESRASTARANHPARLASADGAQRAQATDGQRSIAAAPERSSEFVSPRSDGAAASANRPARSVERQIQSRSAQQREALPAARPALAAPASTTRATAAPQARSTQDARGSARVEQRQTQRTVQSTPPTVSAAPPASAGRVQGRVAEPRPTVQSAPRSAPVQPAGSQPAAATRPASVAPSQPRSAPQRAAAPAPSRSAESRPAQPPRAAPQRQTGAVQSAPPARNEARVASERRPARRVD